MALVHQANRKRCLSVLLALLIFLQFRLYQVYGALCHVIANKVRCGSHFYMLEAKL